MTATLTGPAPVVDRPAEDRPSPPKAPRTLEEAGLDEGFVCDLLLKTLHVFGDLQGAELARRIRLPFGTIETPLRRLKDRLLVEITQGQVVGPVSYQYTLSDRGRLRAQDLMNACAYVGPAPVPLEQYAERARRQDVRSTTCTPDRLEHAFDGLVIGPDLLDELGPAICSGRSLFLYGPPGNGKTCIAKALGQFLNTHGGEIYVPYALLAEASIITVFDDSIHEATDAPAERVRLDEPDAVARLLTGGAADDVDGRWRRVRRPVIVTGGELTLEMLELQYNRTGNYYQAPMHLKANGGVFLIDDFGRQLVSPRDLLNRWILPLEERVDFLALHTGRKVRVPFEQLIIFSTNLEPDELVDDAFLRRMRHKIKIDSPTPALLTEIFKVVCEQKGIEFQDWVVEHLFEEHYRDGQRIPRCSDPRDLLEVVRSVCAYRSWPVHLEREIVLIACDRFYTDL